MEIKYKVYCGSERKRAPGLPKGFCPHHVVSLIGISFQTNKKIAWKKKYLILVAFFFLKTIKRANLPLRAGLGYYDKVVLKRPFSSRPRGIARFTYSWTHAKWPGVMLRPNTCGTLIIHEYVFVPVKRYRDREGGGGNHSIFILNGSFIIAWQVD